MKINKKILTIIIIIVIVIISVLLITINKEDKDSKQFRKDYKDVIVEKNNPIIYLNDDNFIKSLSTNDKLVFIGKPSQDESKKAVTVLLKVAKDNGIDKIYYYDTTNIKNKTEITTKLTEKLEREGIVSPTLFLVKNKKVVKIQEGLDNDLEAKYEDIMLEYIMCTSNC